MPQGTIDDLFQQDDERLADARDIEDFIAEAEEEHKNEKFPEKPYDLRRSVTRAQWQEMEDYYIGSVQAIHIPEEPDASEVLSLNSRIDWLYTQARFDQAFMSRQLKRYKGKMDNAKKTVYKQIKDVARNDKERDALGIDFLEQNSLPGDPSPIFDMVDEFTDRDEFMDAVISTLKAKADKLIVTSAALKLEISLIR